MKRWLSPTAFEWLADVKAAEDYGRKAALAFAAPLRADVRRVDLRAGAETYHPPYAIAGDQDFTEWTVEVSLERLVSDWIKNCAEAGDAAALDRTIAMLDALAARARKARSKVR